MAQFLKIFWYLQKNSSIKIRTALPGTLVRDPIRDEACREPIKGDADPLGSWLNWNK